MKTEYTLVTAIIDLVAYWKSFREEATSHRRIRQTPVRIRFGEKPRRSEIRKG